MTDDQFREDLKRFVKETHELRDLANAFYRTVVFGAAFIVLICTVFALFIPDQIALCFALAMIGTLGIVTHYGWTTRNWHKG